MRPYDHIERYGSDETEGIDIGTLHVFPKLDGANARIAIGEDGRLLVGSRTRIITPEQDCHGLAAWAPSIEPKVRNLITLLAALGDRPEHAFTLYGEWLVPHTLKTYREEAWRRLWLFDIHDGERYVYFETWRPLAEEQGLDVVPLLCTIRNASPEQVQRQVESNTVLIRDGCGLGEGVVVKNYAWRNKYGRQPWGKIVRNEFKETNRRLFGEPEKTGELQVEAEIARAVVTGALVDKERAKIGEVPRAQLIPRLLETVFHCVVTEELWNQLKKHNFPKVDFKRLRTFCIAVTKELSGDLFS